MEFIRIGHGGGFTGQETIFTLHANGTIERDGKGVGRMSKSQFRQLASNLTTLDLASQSWNQPGNLYRFIEFNMDQKSNRLTWDPNSKEINPHFTLFYELANHSIHKAIQ